jgi:periplasmic divalent cation tolerance protein
MKMSPQDFWVVLVTTPDEKVAGEIAEKLVEEDIAACVNILPGVKSLFSWQRKLSREEETLMIVKTRRAFFKDRVVPLIQEHHPYQVPEIIALPIAGASESYLHWMAEETA